MSDSTEPGGPPPAPRPTRSSVATAVLMVGLLAAFVWVIRPPHSDFKPAPLDQLPEECPKVGRAFVPSNVTEILDPPLTALTPEEPSDAVYRMNFKVCPCGCNQSIAECRATHPQCKVCRSLAENVIAESRIKSNSRK